MKLNILAIIVFFLSANFCPAGIFSDKVVSSRVQLTGGMPEEEKPDPFYFFICEKKNQQFGIYKFNGKDYEEITKYFCSTGKNKGDKIRQGDNRTPEGTYLITRQIPKSRLSEKYGYAAFDLNYPSLVDRKSGKNGNGLWLHGAPSTRPPYDSEGCVVLSDSDLKKVMLYIRSGDTLIYICEEKKLFTPEEIKKISDFIENWRKARESLNREKYRAFYADDFYSEDKNKEQWSEYTRKVNKNETFVKIDLSQIKILPYSFKNKETLALVFFNQAYSSGNLKSDCRKMLYLKAEADGWKILAEDTI